ncbi:hypothetical protein PCANC_02021 [Puccinia coronata f. sp. avenae]|uniref:Uncharacterized protein n=1 Tax=Puccinia coronata f. sp. avenae TaxID=200324 RepID=A0A2N5W228_9BASI|nr:hypothetical protein PCANC_07678 [Puccinia coronata f. sp. avenae]PLW25727.1 hypothetical protein PCASD_26625 [Puccinia coronata f. sp. avenae]PLW56265.1 hypothetical protein PCANC_02021 [Puccinia coronata f. sp. avenae]
MQSGFDLVASEEEEFMSSHQPQPRSTFNQLFQGALLDGLKLSSIVIPSGIVIHQVRQSRVANSQLPIGTTTTTASSSSSSSSSLPSSSAAAPRAASTAPKISSLNYHITHFLKWNGLLTFGFGFVYAAVLSSTSSLIHNNIRPVETLTNGNKSTSQFTTRSNDYSIIGGTLGGLITATVFWKRRLLSLLSVIPGGIGIGIGAGLVAAYLHSRPQPRSPPHPSSSTSQA